MSIFITVVVAFSLHSGHLDRKEYFSRVVVSTYKGLRILLLVCLRHMTVKY